MSDAKVKGLAELKAAMAQLPEKLERNVLRGAMRAGLKPAKVRAQETISRDSGELADSVRIGTKVKNGKVIGKLTMGASKKNKKPFYAHMYEFGTKRHIIKARRGKLLAVGVAKVEHPGARPRGSLRASVDGTLTEMVQGYADYTRKRLSTKHGIDVPAPLEEGDEP